MTKSKGLGDDVAKITSTLRLDKLAESITKSLGKQNCGCGNRQEKLNKMFPYGDNK